MMFACCGRVQTLEILHSRLPAAYVPPPQPFRMDPELQWKIRRTVTDILKEADMNQATEFKIRVLASMRLGIDLSDIDRKNFVRGVVESFLLKSAEPLADEETVELPAKKEIELDSDGNRFICKLSNRRSVMVHDYMGKSLVSIRDYYLKNGLELPSAKGISLTAEQWSVLRESFGDIDSAITIMQSRLRSDRNGSLMGNPVSSQRSDEQVLEQVVSVPTVLQSEKDGNGVTTSTPTDLQFESVSNGVTTSTPCGEVPNSSFASTSCEPVSNPGIPSSLEENTFIRVNVDRFDGKNYKSWVRNMELFLKQLKVSHVLYENPPLNRAAEQKWLDEDHMCRLHILNSLSDCLYHQFLKTTKTARELWDQLNQIYLFGVFGSRRAQVKKYMEFQIVDDGSIVDQVHELNCIADAIVAGGTVVQEFFHVSAVISKLPPSWKSFCNKLVLQEHLPFVTLMEMIKVEEEIRRRNKQGEFASNDYSHVVARTRDVKRPSMQWKRQEMEAEEKNRTMLCYCCGKKGHVAKQCPDRKFDYEAHESHSRSLSSSIRDAYGDGGKNSWHF